MSETTAVTLLGSGSIFIVIGINNAGQVLEGLNNGTLWLNGVVTDTGIQQGLALNNNGVVVGQTAQGQAAISQNGIASVLPISPVSAYYYAQGINDSGTAAGIAFTDLNNDLFEAIVWQNGQASVLPGLGGGKSSAKAINNAGEIVGFSATAAGNDHAVAWINGAITDLGLLPGDTLSLAHAINQTGEVVGVSSQSPVTDSHAVAWIKGQIVNLGELPGSYNGATAYAVNDSGVVVGTDYTGLRSTHAVAWINGGIVDLNNLIDPNSGWVLQDAYGINDHNQVVGTGSYNGVSAGFLLTLPANAAPILTVSAALAAGAGWIAGTSVGDSAAKVDASLDALQGLVAGGKLTSITLTDSTVPTLALSATQLTSDAAALADIGSSYALTVTAGSTGQTIAGPAGHGMTVVLPGNASDYTIASAGNQVTVTGDGAAYHLTTVAALQFADHTDILAAAPGNGAVTTGNITELYSAVLGREPDVAGLSFYQNYLAANPATPLLQFAQWFLASPEYAYVKAHQYAETSAGDQQFITDSYQNLLHRTPDADEIAFYQAKVMALAEAGLTSGTSVYRTAQLQAHAQMLVYFSASPEFLTDVQITAAHPTDAQHWLVLT